MKARPVGTRSVLVLVVLAIAAGGVRFSKAQDVQEGKASWAAVLCKNCHGENGEGGFGPDLAGRQLSEAQFRHAVRKPWGIMPAFTEQQMSDQELANVSAYLNRLPRVAQPGPWRTALQNGAPGARQLVVGTVGCGQCHGPVLAGPRQDAGAVAADFQWFADLVYDHTGKMPAHHRLLGGDPNRRFRMGNYSRTRLPESLLREIWAYVNDLGLRVPLLASLSAEASSGNGVTYTLELENEGLPGKGLTAEDLTVSLELPPGSSVVSANGTGYQGVRKDSRNNAETAVWQVSRMGPKDEQTFTITLARAGSGRGEPHGSVRWAKPPLGDGSNDSIEIAPPRR